MGELNIRYRNQRLAVAPRIQVANYEKAAAIGAQTAALRARHMDELGRSISSGLTQLGSAVMGYVAARDERKVDEAVTEYQRGMNAFNNGVAENGSGGATYDSMMGAAADRYGVSPTGGAMRQQIDDEEEWKKNNVRFRDDFAATLKKDLKLSDDQFARMKRSVVGFDLSMQNGWQRRADEVFNARAVGNAQGRFDAAQGVVRTRDCDPSAWIEWKDSMDNLIAARERAAGRKFGADERQMLERKAALGVCTDGVRSYIEDTNARAVAAGADGDKVFDERIRAMEGTDDDSFLPPSSNITDPKTGKSVNFLRDALKGADMKGLKAAAIRNAKEAKNGWEAGMRKHTKEQFANAQNDILAIPAPEDGDEVGQKNYQREVADAYRKLIAKDQNVLSGKVDEWVRDDLKKFAPEKVAVALRAIKGADDKADRARVRANGQLFTRAVQFGVVDPETPGGFRQLSASEKRDMAEFMFVNDEISHEDYVKGIKAANAESSPLVNAFFQRIAKGLDAKFPNVCEWQADQMKFKFRDTKEARELAAKSNGVETTVAWDDVVQGKVVKKVDREETWTYGQYADAASLVAEKIILAGPRKGESDAELLDRAEQEFRRLTVGTEDDVMRLSIKRRTEEYRKNVETLKNVRRGKMGVRFLPQGIELSRQTKAKVRASANKE